jgi:hypothetical protein
MGEPLNSASGVAGSSPAIGGLNASGQLTSNSREVFNLKGISLNSSIDNETHGSVVTSTGKNVHLDSGTQMLLVVQSSKSNLGTPVVPEFLKTEALREGSLLHRLSENQLRLQPGSTLATGNRKST